MPTPRNPGHNPYVGPRSFEPGERLYGRDTETRKLTNLLGAERIVLLHSPSGAGKTSLIQAALIPRMRERKFHVRPVARVNHEAAQPPSNGYNRYVFSVLSSLESDWPDDQQLPNEELAGLTLPTYLERRPRPEGVNFELLIFDQFEEILTLDPTDQAAKHAFFAQLGEALEDRTRWALFALREDFLGALAPYVIPVPSRLSTTFRLDLLAEDAARQALQRPAREAGAEFDDAAAQALVDDLRRVQVQRPDGTLETQLGPHVEPVQLQVVGYRLWESLNPDDTHIDQGDLATLGDVGHALAEYYAGRVAAIAQECDVSERAIREWCDRKLITEQGIRGQVLMGRERSEGLENRAVRMLENAHLVRAEKRGGATWYELAHDRLIERVRADNAARFAVHLSLLQRQAQLWDDERRPDGLLLRGKELKDAEAWAAAHASEVSQTEHEFLEDSRSARSARQAQARVNRRLRTALIASVLIALVALVFMMAALIFGVQAYQNNQMAQARLLATASGRKLNDGDKPLATLLAFQALQQYPYTVEAEGALGNVVRPQLQLGSFSTRFGSVLAATFDRPGTQVTTISDDGSLRRWTTANGQLVSTITGTIQLSQATFSPDGARIITASYDQTARVWDAASGKLLVTLAGHTGSVNTAAFSSDGTRVVTASDDGTTRIWDVEHGLELFLISGSTSSVRSTMLDNDSSHLLIGRGNGLLQRWQVWPSRQALLEYARSICGTCEPDYEQRVEFRIYNWPMLVFEYRQILTAIWFGLLYLIGGWVIYRGMLARLARAAPTTNPGFSWKRFGAAGAQGGLAVALVLTGILLIWLTEAFYFGNEETGTRSGSPAEFFLQGLFVLPVGLWAGGAYSHFTRAQVGGWARRKRMLLGGLAGLAGDFLLTLFAWAIMLFWLVRITSRPQNDTLTQWLSLICIPPLVVGVAGGIMAIIGAALYIFALQPLATRWAMHGEEEE